MVTVGDPTKSMPPPHAAPHNAVWLDPTVRAIVAPAAAIVPDADTSSTVAVPSPSPTLRAYSVSSAL